MSVTIDAGAFRRRLHVIQREIKDNKQFEGVGSILTILGKGETESQGVHAAALHEKAVIVTSVKQATYLQELKSSSVEIRTRPKAVEDSKEAFGKVLDEFSSGKVGYFAADKPQSPIADAWAEGFAARTTKDDLVDLTGAFDSMLHNKDEEELRAIRTASKASVGIMTSYLADEMAQIIDEGSKVTHAAFSDKVAAVRDDEKFFRKLKLGSSFDIGSLDWAPEPIIQSGGNFDLSPGAKSDDTFLKPGVIYALLIMRYKFYTAAVGRTYLIDASKEQEQNYTTLVGAEKRAIAASKDGATAAEVYAAALDYIKERDANLVSHLVPSIGHSVGIQYDEAGLTLSPDNKSTLRDGMTLVLNLAFENLKDGHDQPYALALVNTLRVTTDVPVVFTDSPRTRQDISFALAQDEEPQKKSRRDNAAALPSVRSARQEKREPEETVDLRIEKHQTELKHNLQDRGLAKYGTASGGLQDTSRPEFKKYESYKRESQLPNLKDLRITLDQRAQTVIIPISGRPVPFHINSYKNGSRHEEGDYVYLRLNFNSPDGQIIKGNDVPFQNPQATFLKSITLRSRDTERMNDTFKKLQDMKREATRLESERKEMANVVKQDKLVEIKDRRPLRLEPIYVRPMPEGKRVAGSLEIHKNGVRYHSPLGKEQQVDVLFSNVDNLFFQPSDNELIVLIHFHLKNPIIVGKRKTQDVQFYRDATDVAFDDTGNRRRRYKYGDEDELEQEQEERRMRARLNKEFKAFSEQISKATNGKLEVDIPFRDLGFYGAPFRSNVFLQPTADCLVQLVDTPFLVVRLADVELAYLERIQFGLREFDLAFIYKDFTRPVTHVNTIPVAQLDSIKEWLNEMDIPFYEGSLNMKWPAIMKTIQSDPHDFFKTGGWSFLSAEGDSDKEGGGEGEGENSENEESEFEVSDAAPEDESDSYSEAESEDFDENSFDEESGDEDGPGWDELEEEAEREDRRKEQKSDRRRA